MAVLQGAKDRAISDGANVIEIPGYRILRQLGRGGMAAVYLAIQESVDREVALKVMSPALLVDPNFGERFLREARIAAKLHHRNVVAVHDVGRHGDLHYIAMEYLPLGPVLTKDGSSREIAFSLRVAREIATALGYAHGKGFIHRDVKPDNVLLRDDGSSALTDFGIARATDSASRMTRTGAVIGTPHYMSPEQARGKTIDGRADLYSLGVVLYELLVGRVPYVAEDSLAVGIMHITEPVPTLPDALADLQPLLDRLLAKTPDERFATGEQVADAVREIEMRLANGELPHLLQPTEAERREILSNIADAPRHTHTPSGARPVTPSQPASIMTPPRATPPRVTPPPVDEPATLAVSSDAVRAQSGRAPPPRRAEPAYVDDRPGPQLGRIDDLAPDDGRRRPHYGEPRARRGIGVWLVVVLVLAGIGVSAWLNQDRLRGLLPETELNTKLDAADAALLDDRLYGVPNSALDLYGEALKLDPDNSRAVAGRQRVGQRLILQARRKLEAGDFTGARAQADVARQILQGGPQLDELDAAFAESETRLVQMTELLDNARKAREAGNLVGREDSAVSFYNQMLAADPGNSIAAQGIQDIVAMLATQAHRLVDERKFDEARAVVESIGRVRPNASELPELQAKLADTSRQDAEALAASLTEGETLLRQGRTTAALPLFRAVLAKDPDNARARSGVARIGEALVVQANAALDQSDAGAADRLLKQAAGVANAAELRAAQVRLRELREKLDIAKANVVTPEQQARVGVLLKEAEDAAAAGLMFDPPGDSAYDKYRAALRIDAQNAAAKAGLAALPAKAKAQFAIAIGEGKNNTARALMDAVEQITSNDPELPAMRLRLAQSWLKQAEGQIGVSRFEDAIKSINKARELAPSEPGIAAVEEKLRVARGGG